MNNNAMRCSWPILLLLMVAVGWSWAAEGIVFDLVGDADAATRLDRLKQFFQSFGAVAPLIYFLFVVTEVVVAPIPGLMLYAPGGIVFGPLLGGSLSLLGNVAGAGIACSLTRSLGSDWLKRFFDSEKLEQAQAEVESRGALLIFLLRLNPLTSSDIVSYAAGFTRIPVWQVMLATGCGMAPLCFAQAWLAEGLIKAFPQLIYPLIAACFVYLICVLMVMRRILSPAA